MLPFRHCMRLLTEIYSYFRFVLFKFLWTFLKRMKSMWSENLPYSSNSKCLSIFQWLNLSSLYIISVKKKLIVSYLELKTKSEKKADVQKKQRLHISQSCETSTVGWFVLSFQASRQSVARWLSLFQCGVTCSMTISCNDWVVVNEQDL